MKRLIGFITLTLALYAHAASAQNRVAEKEATAVAQSFFTALSEKRWDDAARLLDLDAFGAYRKSVIAGAKRMPAQQADSSADFIMLRDSTMPRAVAEWFEQQAAATRKQRPFNFIEFEFADVPTADSLAALPLVVAASRWLQAKDPVSRMRFMNGDASCKEMDGTYIKPPRNIIRATAVTDSVAYVVYDQDFGVLVRDSAPRALHVDYGDPVVLILRRNAGRWRVRPSTVGSGPELGSGIDCSIVDNDGSSTKKRSH